MVHCTYLPYMTVDYCINNFFPLLLGWKASSSFPEVLSDSSATPSSSPSLHEFPPTCIRELLLLPTPFLSEQPTELHGRQQSPDSPGKFDRTERREGQGGRNDKFLMWKMVDKRWFYWQRPYSFFQQCKPLTGRHASNYSTCTHW